MNIVSDSGKRLSLKCPLSSFLYKHFRDKYAPFTGREDGLYFRARGNIYPELFWPNVPSGDSQHVPNHQETTQTLEI